MSGMDWGFLDEEEKQPTKKPQQSNMLSEDIDLSKIDGNVSAEEVQMIAEMTSSYGMRSNLQSQEEILSEDNASDADAIAGIAASLNEEIEQIDEISKSTLRSYIDKASDEVERREKKAQNVNLGRIRGKRNDAQIDKRQTGIEMAKKKMAPAKVPASEGVIEPAETSKEKSPFKRLRVKLAEEFGPLNEGVNLTKLQGFLVTQTHSMIKNADMIDKRLNDYFNFVNRFNWDNLQMKELMQVKNRLEETENFLHTMLEIYDKTAVQLKQQAGIKAAMHESAWDNQQNIKYLKQDIADIEDDIKHEDDGQYIKSLEARLAQNKKKLQKLMSEQVELDEAFKLGAHKDYFLKQGAALKKHQHELMQTLHGFLTFIEHFSWSSVDAHAKSALQEEFSYIEEIAFSIQNRIENLLQAINEH